jgi:hypothetical protein
MSGLVQLSRKGFSAIEMSNLTPVLTCQLVYVDNYMKSVLPWTMHSDHAVPETFMALWTSRFVVKSRYCQEKSRTYILLSVTLTLLDWSAISLREIWSP